MPQSVLIHWVQFDITTVQLCLPQRRQDVCRLVRSHAVRSSLTVEAMLQAITGGHDQSLISRWLPHAPQAQDFPACFNRVMARRA